MTHISINYVMWLKSTQIFILSCNELNECLSKLIFEGSLFNLQLL